jgi:putative oxidoreductase
MNVSSLLSLRVALIVLRIGTPLLFIAHAVTRIAVGSIPQFARFLGELGFPEPTLLVWAITVTELIAGGLLILGRRVRFACAALASIAFGGIALIHARLGWFVGEHGTGGSEYSVCLLMCLLVLAAADVRETSPQPAVHP